MPSPIITRSLTLLGLLTAIMVGANAPAVPAQTTSTPARPFTPSPSGARATPVTVTATDSSGSLPSGSVVVVSDVGAFPMYCNVNGTAATSSDQLIAPSSWFAFTVPSGITVLHCIAPGGVTTANVVGGTGLPTGAGGGGGGGGGGGIVTQGPGGSSAWLTTGTGGTFPATQSGPWNITNVTGTLPLPTGAATSANQPTNAAVGSVSTGQTGTVSMGFATTGTASYTTGTTNPMSIDPNGNLRINCMTGCGGGAGGTASSFGNAFPTQGTAIGLSNGTNMVGWLATTNYGVAPGAVTVPAVNAAVTNTVASGQSGTWTVQPGNVANTTAWLVTGTGGTFPATQSGAWNIGQTGTWTVQPGNVANTTPWLTTISQGGTSAAVGSYGTAPGAVGALAVNAAVTNSPAVTQSGAWSVGVTGTLPLPVGAATAGNQPTNSALGQSTTGTTGNVSLGTVTSTTPSYSAGTNNALSLDATGNLRINCITGCGGGAGGTASTFNNAFPTQGTAIGLTNGTNMVPWSATTTYGTAPAAIAVPAVNASVTNTVASAQSGTWTVQPGNVANTTAWLVTGAGGTFPATQFGAWNVGQTGTWTVQPGNVANTTPWLTTIAQGGTSATVGTYGTAPGAVGALAVNANVTNANPNGQNTMANSAPVVIASNQSAVPTTVTGTVPLPTGASTAALQPTNATLGSTTSGQTGSLTLAAVTTAAPTYTTGQTNALSLDTAGNLRVNVVAGGGGGGGGTSSNFGSAFPSTGTAIGLTSGTNMVPWSATTTYGTAPAAIAVPSVNAFVTNTNANGQATMAASNPVVIASNQSTLPINCVSGCTSTGGTSSTFGSAFPTTGTAIGLTTGTNMIAWSATSNYGTAPAAIAVPSVNAFVTNATANIGNNVDGVATSGTAAPPVVNYNYVYNGTTWDRQRAGTITGAASVQPVAADPCAFAAKINVPISTATGTTALVTGVSAKRIYVCSLSVIAAAAVSVSLSEGASATCGTSAQAAVLGVATNGTAANGLALAANGGLTLGSGTGTVAQTATAANYLCLFQSSTVQLAGNLTYVQQ